MSGRALVITTVAGVMVVAATCTASIVGLAVLATVPAGGGDLGLADRSDETPPEPVGGLACPLPGGWFTDTFGAPRPGGRRHLGVDMFARHGAPVYSPADGRMEAGRDRLGGLVVRIWADDGTYWYLAHLSSTRSHGSDRVAAGEVVGHNGNSGNAAGTPPHLHLQQHPAGRGTRPVNPTPTVARICPDAHPLPDPDPAPTRPRGPL